MWERDVNSPQGLNPNGKKEQGEKNLTRLRAIHFNYTRGRPSSLPVVERSDPDRNLNRRHFRRLKQRNSKLGL